LIFLGDIDIFGPNCRGMDGWTKRNKWAGARPAPTVVARNKWAGAMPIQNKWAGVRPAQNHSTTVGEMVGTFKSLSVHDWLGYMNQNNIHATGKFWQRNYYEHIIRNDIELNNVRQYIQNNPLKWRLDRENPQREGNDLLEDEIFRVKGLKPAGQSVN
jgi:hypothetical protein